MRIITTNKQSKAKNIKMIQLKMITTKKETERDLKNTELLLTLFPWLLLTAGNWRSQNFTLYIQECVYLFKVTVIFFNFQGSHTFKKFVCIVVSIAQLWNALFVVYSSAFSPVCHFHILFFLVKFLKRHSQYVKGPFIVKLTFQKFVLLFIKVW